MKKILTKFIFTSVIIALFSQIAVAKDVRMFLDFARFRYDEHHTYLEIYYMLYNLDPNQVDTREINLEFYLQDISKDSLLAKNNLKVTMEPPSAAGETGIQGSVIKTVLPEGRYSIKMVRMSDDKAMGIDSLYHEFTAPTFSKENKIVLSDIELCSNIKTGAVNRNGLFYKNTMEVYPNPMRMYNAETPRLFYYLEMYNLKSEVPGAKVDIEIAIADTDGKIVANKRYSKNQAQESAVEVGSFDVSDYKNGLYTLIYAVVDKTSNYSVYTRANFYIMKPGQSDQEFLTLFPQSEFATATEAELDEMFDQARYIANKEEVQIYQSLDTVESKRMFLFRFWAGREQDSPGLRHEYYARVAYANDLYAFSTLDGWESDRGRIYVKYGEPNQIDRQPNSREYRPYIVWFYHNLDGGARFLFIDESGFGDYRLVSSTLRGEIYDASYDELLLNSQP